LYVLFALLSASALGVFLCAAEPAPEALRERARKAMADGNFKDAYEAYRKLALNPETDRMQVAQDYQQAVQALVQLGRTEEVDAFREKTVEAHLQNWRLLQAAAHSLLQGEHYGYIVAGEFYRGHKRGGGRFVSSAARDRVRALQLLEQARALIPNEQDRAAIGRFYLEYADAMLQGGGDREAWRLQSLTDLKTLPDYEEAYRRFGFGGDGPQGAPVDAEGNPIYYSVPKRFDEAQSDGERWRWLLAQAAEADPKRLNETRLRFANFLHQQFGVQTMAQYGWFFNRGDEADDQQPESGTYALHTLGEDETIAKLATGIKRFKLPDEFNFIKIYQQVAADGKSSWGEQALGSLAELFTDRRQYPRAVEYWRKNIAQYGRGPDQSKQLQVNQIIKNWGRFEHVTVQPAGTGATVDFIFRNGKHVDFEAHEIKIPKLLDDVKAYVKSNPRQLDGNKLNLAGIGYRLVEQNETQYLGAKVATWGLDLEPRPNHFDKRITVTTPLQKSGAYLLTGKLADGNVSRIIIWVSDTVIAKKQLDGRTLYFVADAVTGKPIPQANVEFFGWRQSQVGNTNQFQILTSNFALLSDADGQVLPDPQSLKSEYQWIAIARTPQQRLAFLGFSGVWYGTRYDEVFNQVKVFTITDRPVYRPQQTAKFKFWIRRAQYDREQPDSASEFADREFSVQINNPQGQEVQKKRYKTDAYGGFEGEYTLPKEAPLGPYSLQIVDSDDVHGGGSFRVEEYKKPEFEVTVEAPAEPVMLGEKITAKIKAKYYFGAPVTKAKVKYKVLRNRYSEQWYPFGRWDWLYGRGYWWFASDYSWYPGWKSWGIQRPHMWWWPAQHEPPEVVAEAEVAIGPEGQVEFKIDTAVAKAIHGNQDHQYSITAEVVDESRRTIVGTGKVLVARKPFKVFAWVDRGHYRVGDVIDASFTAQTLDQKPVEGQGELTLLKVTYNEKGEPVEVPVQTWKLDTNAEGRAEQQLKATAAGQYRLSYKLADAKQHTIEGGYLFVVRGEGFDGREFRFNDLELIADKREYAPGDTVKLLINTNRVGSTVLLFLRPANGVYLPPKVLRLTGKSTVEEFAVVQKDMPNFFIEALTISGGQLYTETRELVVPPEKRVLNVAVVPSAAEYKPGAEAKVQIKLTDLDGKPFQGSTVVTMYDKSIEYISGGSNVPEIKAFFWKWRRHHSPQTESSLALWFDNLLKSREIAMSNLGVFGHSVADEQDERGAGGGDRSFVRINRASAAPAGGAPEKATMAAAPRGMALGEVAADATPLFGADKQARGGDGGGAELVAPTVRKNFADAAFWAGALTTDANGQAEFSLTMPENLTGWKIKTWALGQGTRVGEGEAEVVTSKKLLVRMQAPRFFVETDEVVLSANVHNYLPTEKAVEVALQLDGKQLTATTDLVQKISVKANGEQRVDWRVKASAEGEAVVRMQALTDEESDAMEMRFPVYVHGMLKTESYTGVIRPDQEAGSITLKIPAERRINDARIEVRYSPTLAGAMVDALPYLVDYPYGCTEQTLNRFLPTVITQKILLGMQLDLKAIQEKRTNLNAQEIGDDRDRARQWKRFDRNPVFDQDEVTRMAQAGLKALTEMQLSDGGWGWFSGWGEHSSAHTTALVVHGLQVARQNDVAVVPDVLARGVEWLKRYQAEQLQQLKNAASQKKPWKNSADNLDALVYSVLADADVADAEMRDFLYRDRTKLGVYGMALYGLALEKQAQPEKLAMILENIEQYLVQDNENQTAYLKLPNEGTWWYWYGSDIEANAFYLKLLAKTDPKGEKGSRLVKYLLNNRKHATYWNSTRDTAFVIEALADYLVASGEDRPDMTVAIYLDGKQRKEIKISPENLFSFDNKFILEGDDVKSGPHQLELRRAGKGPLYYNAYVTNFTLEEFITRAGLEIKVNRKYYKLHKEQKAIQVAGARGQSVDQKVEKYVREELPNLGTLKSGDLVEIELEIDSKNDYEYLIFEDLKAAGFEPVELQSGYTRNDLGAYVEFRDERVAFFVRTLARGKHSVSYRMRAEIPGRFSALPTKASAMYAPELKGNSDEIKIVIED
jgi:hypothetical protein